ncbi:hypothetical protein [Shewanella sp. 30m-9]
MDTHNTNSTRRKPWIALGVIASIVVLFAVLVMVMPKGFKATHEQIGSGKPTVVFVYDNGLAVSNSQTEQMNDARDQLGDQAYFLIATTGSPEGELLIAKHRADSAELLLFDPSGRLVKRQYALKTADELVRWIQ